MQRRAMDRGCAILGRLCLGAFVAMAGLTASNVVAAPPVQKSEQTPDDLEANLHVLKKGSSTEEAKTQGLAELPLSRLSPARQTQAQAVLSSLSLFRELPTLAFEVDPEVHQFFLEHPDAAVSIWRAMEISKFQLTETQPGTYAATDQAGTTGTVELLYRDKHQVLVLCQGVIKSPILAGAVQVQALLHLQTDFVKSRDDRVWSRNRLRTYVAFPSQTIETAAKLVSPLTNLIIDRNLREVCLFLHVMSSAMARQPGWVERLARRMEDVPQARKSELIDLTVRVFVAARKRKLSRHQAEDDVSLQEVLRPLEPARE